MMIITSCIVLHTGNLLSRFQMILPQKQKNGNYVRKWIHLLAVVIISLYTY